MKRIRAESQTVRKTKEGQPVFVKGGVKPEGSGRKKGQKNRHTIILKDCLMTAMQMVGNNNRGREGAEGYLAWLAWKHPDIFGKLLEKMLPYSLSGAGGGPVQIEYTNREEILLRLKERGLPMPTNLLAPPRRSTKEVLPVQVLDEEED